MLFSIALTLSIVLAVLAVLFRTLLRRMSPAACDPLEWLDDFSAASYRPMERLLDSRDYAFLASQAGYKPSISRRLRRERREIFQAYLRTMASDFHRLLSIAKFITVYATEDAAAFEADLWRMRWSFYRSMIALEARATLATIGLGAPDTRGLVASLERMQVYTQKLMPAGEPMY